MAENRGSVNSLSLGRLNYTTGQGFSGSIRIQRVSFPRLSDNLKCLVTLVLIWRKWLSLLVSLVKVIPSNPVLGLLSKYCFIHRKYYCFFCGNIKALFIRRKPIPGRRITIPADLTQASVYMRKSLSLCPIHTTLGMLCGLSRLNRVDPEERAKLFIGEKLAQLKTCEQALLGALAVGREKEGINWIPASKSRCEMLIDGDDIINDVITLSPCFLMFVYIRASFRFALFSGNLTAQSTRSNRGIGGGIQIPETELQALLSFPSQPPERAGEPARRRAQLRGWTLLLLLVSHVNGSPRFVRKCMKCWPAQGISGKAGDPSTRGSFFLV